MGREVVTVWASLDFICAERLTPTLVETARHLGSFGALTHSAAVEAQLGQLRRSRRWRCSSWGFRWPRSMSPGWLAGQPA